MQKKKVNRIMILLMAIIVFIVYIPIDVYATNAAKTLPALTGNQGVDAVRIAASQIGYNAGTNKDNIYAKDLGGTNNADWCAYFVTWCAKKSGLASSNYPSSSDFGRVTRIFKWFKDRGRWHRKNGTSWTYNGLTDDSNVDSSYIPQAGDLVLFETGSYSDGPDHIGMVESASNGTLTYIHGNTSGGSGTSTVKRATCSLTNSIIWGYCSPAYTGGGSNDTLPHGCIDSVTGGEKSITVRGWAFDQDVPSKQLEIHVYVGGDSNTANAEAYVITANKYRPDVNTAYGTGDYHGFEETIAVNKTGTQEVYIYAINPNSHNHTVLGHCTVHIKKENKINFPSSTITLNKGESKTITFTFQGDGIYALGSNIDNDNISRTWSGVDWSVPKASITINGLKEGTTKLDIHFVDSNGTSFYMDGINVTVNHIHRYTTEKITKQPTCTSTGIMSYVCSCGDISSSTQTIASTGHTIVKDAEVAPTCTKSGKTSGTHCSVCKTTIIQQQTIPATGHKGGTATCTQQAKCKTCGSLYGNTANHTFSSQWTIDKQATCTTQGSKSHHCQNCNAKKDVTIIQATGHTGGKATCSSLAKCSVCGCSYGSYMNHVYGKDWTIDKQATCTTEGSKSLHCKNCGEKVEEVTIRANGHRGGTATCSSQAKCDTCGEYYGDYKNHKYLDGTCTVCGASNGSQNNVNQENNTTDIENDKQDNKQDEENTKNDEENNIWEDEEEFEEETAEDVGDVLEDENTGHMYEITNSSSDQNTVEYFGNFKNKKTIVIPDEIVINGVTYEVTSIAECAFEGKTKITKVVIGENVTLIGTEAFSKCKNLRSITIGGNVTQIGAKAFYNCSKMTKITIPEKVSKIGKSAFYGCRKLKNITIKTKKLTSSKVGAKAFKHIYSKAKVTVPKGKAKAYKKLLRSKGASSNIKVK